MSIIDDFFGNGRISGISGLDPEKVRHALSEPYNQYLRTQIEEQIKERIRNGDSEDRAAEKVVKAQLRLLQEITRGYELDNRKKQRQQDKETKAEYDEHSAKTSKEQREYNRKHGGSEMKVGKRVVTEYVEGDNGKRIINGEWAEHNW